MNSLRSLSQDDSIVIKKADKSNMIVIMNKTDYIKAIERQLTDEKYYTRLDENPSKIIEQNILNCVNKISETNSAVEREFDPIPDNVRVPQFYILPKTHKQYQENLPIGFPGRPIVSACNSYTEKISKYVDYILQPYMKSLPSYVKDTTYFIGKIKSVPKLSRSSLLVTLDVTSLYTNIPHKDRIEACKYYLSKDKSISELSPDEICSLVKLTLENNHFQFNEKNYIQKHGTAMGTSMAPTYASLFMGKLENDFIEQCSLKPTTWLRFLDDIFMIWDHSLAELEDFISRLNSYHPTIKFTHTVSETNVSFLDVNIVKKYRQFPIYRDTHQVNGCSSVLAFSSCHLRKCKESIPYSQAKRYRRIISYNDSFHRSLEELKGHFLNRQYPENVIDSAFKKVLPQTQEAALVNSDAKNKTKDIVPFVIPYNTSLPNLGLIINKYWDLFNLSSKESLNFLHKHKPVIAFKRAKTLQDCLTHSMLNKPNERSQSTKCNRRRCKHCSSI